ncbi:hypothetical protein O988_01563 [Pseudogymnoascus sp. VKM F-3808]|nr:hypothetical protein O988_01563 [Pseudogymnoascus sp. VKM F-3808]
MATKQHIIVIGAGVLGLSCAFQLSKSGYAVTIIARDLPADLSVAYASPWAGAHFRPIPITTPAESIEHGFVTQTSSRFAALAANNPSAGIAFVRGVEYFDAPSAKYTDLDPAMGFCTSSQFRVLRPDELPGGGSGNIKWGCEYEAWVLNSPVYLAWLERHLQLEGVVILRRTLSAIEEAVSVARAELGKPDLEPLAVVNASGMGFADPECFPSRGQFLLVSNPCKETISHHWADGTSTVIIPRPLSGGTLIGGSKEEGNWSQEPCAKTTAAILKRVSELCPEMLTPPVNNPEGPRALHLLKTNVGRRPMRRGGLRVEKEVLTRVETGDDGLSTYRAPMTVIHCYGAGGSGYKVSWGVASKVQDLISGLKTPL